jgi:hypothetical protein
MKKSKTSTKTRTKTSTKKGGNFLGAVGELVAPTGWEGFATAAGLLAIDRADAALRRGKSTKSSAKKGGEGNNTLKPNSVATAYHMGIIHNPEHEKMKYYWQTPEGQRHAEFIRATNEQRKKDEEKAAQRKAERNREYKERTNAFFADVNARVKAHKKKSVANYVADYKIQKSLNNPNSEMNLRRVLRYYKDLNEASINKIIENAKKNN